MEQGEVRRRRTPASPTSPSIPSNSSILSACQLSAAAAGVLLQWWRTWQRVVEDRERGRTWTKITGTGCRQARTGASRSNVARSNPSVVLRTDRGRQSNTISLARGGAPTAANSEATPGRRSRPGTPGSQPAEWRAGLGVAAEHSTRCNNGGPGGGFPALGGGRRALPLPRRIRTRQRDASCARSVARWACFARRTRAETWTLVSNCNARPMYLSRVARRPVEREHAVRRRASGREVARRGQDVRDARCGGRATTTPRTSISTRSGSIQGIRTA